MAHSMSAIYDRVINAQFFMKSKIFVSPTFEKLCYTFYMALNLANPDYTITQYFNNLAQMLIRQAKSGIYMIFLYLAFGFSLSFVYLASLSSFVARKATSREGVEGMTQPQYPASFQM